MNLVLFKDKIKKLFTLEHIVQALSVLLFISYMGQLYVTYAIDYKQVFNGLTTILMIFLRWSTIVAVGFGIISPFHKGKTFNFYAATLTPVVGLLNLVFFKNNMKAWGADIAVPWRQSLFIIEQILLILIGIHQLFIFIKNKRIKELNILRCILVFIAMYASFLYQPIIHIFLGDADAEAVGFNVQHISMLLFIFAFLIVGYLAMNRRTLHEKKGFFAALVISGLFNFFYLAYTGLGSLPFHLCHTALFIMFVAYIFNVKDVFYYRI